MSVPEHLFQCTFTPGRCKMKNELQCLHYTYVKLDVFCGEIPWEVLGFQCRLLCAFIVKTDAQLSVCWSHLCLGCIEVYSGEQQLKLSGSWVDISSMADRHTHMFCGSPINVLQLRRVSVKIWITNLFRRSLASAAVCGLWKLHPPLLSLFRWL